jgi:uncharacterized protein (DUF1015 family)
LATVRPFQGVLYDRNRVDLARVVAPPYDVITPQDQQRYYQQDPCNVVRLIAGEVRPSDDATDNKYTRAAAFFDDWMQRGVLRREIAPGLFVYRQHYVDPTDGVRRLRNGIVGVVELEPFGTGVLPHERTHARAKADRLSLTSAVRANLSMIFALYEDPRADLAGVIAGATTGSPRLSITTDGGELHEVWSLSETDALREVDRVLSGSRLYMADGHHRYETALNFRNRERREYPDAPANAAFNYVLALLVDVADPGLAILPTHRVLHDLADFDGPALISRLSARHVVTPRSDRGELIRAMRESVPGHRIGVALKLPSRHPGVISPQIPSPLAGEGQGGGFRLPSPLTGESRPKIPSPLAGEGQGGGFFLATVDIAPQPTADPVSQLDVSVLHREVLQRELGVEEAMLEQERYVTYSRDVEAALDQVERGQAQAAFLLRPPAVSDVVAVARAGLLMPQKSTYFFPKPLSGIVFNPLNPGIVVPAIN